MEQRGNVAAMKDVRTLLRKEECALDMAQSSYDHEGNIVLAWSSKKMLRN
jgi:hypothetical protein